MRHELLFRKDLMGCASLHPSYGSFHGSRVARRDVKSCYDVAVSFPASKVDKFKGRYVKH
ncbi:MAG: hypothetical protein ABSH41_26395 [Syntrophobacteraceae bacterium]